MKKSYWTLEFEVKEHNLIASISKWGPSYRIKFEVKYLSFDNPGSTDGFADCLRFTTTSQDNGNVGDRIPLFQAGKSGATKSARFSSDIGPSSPNPQVTANSPYLNTNTWYRIEVQQFFDKAQDQVKSIKLKIKLFNFSNQQWRLEFKANGVVRYQTVVSNPREFENVKVYAGMRTAAKARLRNLDWTSCKSSSVHYSPPSPSPTPTRPPFDKCRFKREVEKRFKRRMPEYLCPWSSKCLLMNKLGLSWLILKTCNELVKLVNCKFTCLHK